MITLLVRFINNIGTCPPPLKKEAMEGVTIFSYISRHNQAITVNSAHKFDQNWLTRFSVHVLPGHGAWTRSGNLPLRNLATPASEVFCWPLQALA